MCAQIWASLIWLSHVFEFVFSCFWSFQFSDFEQQQQNFLNKMANGFINKLSQRMDIFSMFSFLNLLTSVYFYNLYLIHWLLWILEYNFNSFVKTIKVHIYSFYLPVSNEGHVLLHQSSFFFCWLNLFSFNDQDFFFFFFHWHGCQLFPLFSQWSNL